MSDLVKMKYTGPNAEGDPRLVEVSESDAKALEKTGLYAKSRSTKKPEDVEKPDELKKEND